MSIPTSRNGDTSDHGGRIITFSDTRQANSRQTARIGDILDCPIHGRQPIVSTLEGPSTDTRQDVCVGAMAACGARIISGSDTVYQFPVQASPSRDQIAIQDHPGGIAAPANSGEAAIQRANFGDAPPIRETNNTPPPNVESTVTNCRDITTDNISLSFQLSTNFNLGRLSKNVSFGSGYNVIPQRGLTVSQIVCNLRAVAENICEKMLTKYPNMIITSGFRVGNGTSQHELGQAVDIQLPGANLDTIWNEAQWIKDNIPYDQFILEYIGRNPWYHLSYGNNRRQVLTCRTPGEYLPGLRRI